MDNTDWSVAQKWEEAWWGNCLDTVNEELKQRTYNKRMGLSSYSYNLRGKNIIDFGGGVISLLLKYVDRGVCYVVDPLPMPDWVKLRYRENGIQLMNIKAEDYNPKLMEFDEAWIYNCLQHTDDPKKIVKKIRASSKIIRVFEWVETGTAPGHIHNLTKKNLDKWFGGEGKVELINENGCYGTCYYGVFKGDLYDL